MSHHKMALIAIAAAVILDIACGIAYSIAEHLSVGLGLYCAEGNAVTEGACLSPSSTAGYVINAIEFITVVPLFAATFSLFTSALANIHVRRAEKTMTDAADEIKQHVTACVPPD